MTESVLARNDRLVVDLRKALRSGDADLRHIPSLILRLLRSEAWRDRHDGHQDTAVHFDRFVDFVTARPTAGLGGDIELVRQLLRHNPEAFDAFDAALAADAPVNQHDKPVDNVNGLSRPTGNSAQAALRRLRKDRPDLHARVLDGTLTAHAAMLQAGFSRPKVTVRLDDMESAARTLVAKLSVDQVQELVRFLKKSA